MDFAEPAQRIEATLAGTLRRQRAVRALESLVLGLTAGGATAAAAVLSGAELIDPGALAAAAVAALAAAGTWWVEKRASRADLARRVDRATRSEGAFVTAVECAARPDGKALAAALVARTARSIDPRAARAAVALPSLALAAAPLAAAALVALALEARAPHRAARQAPWTVRGALALAEAASAGAGDPELAELADLVRELAARPEAESELERALEELALALDERGAEVEEGRAADFERAALEVRAVCDDLARRGDSRRPDAPPAPENDTAGGTGVGAGLAAGGAGSTMGGSLPNVPATTGERGPAPTAAPEAGLVPGRWWDPQYDGVVSAWVLRERARDTDRARDEDRDSE